MTCDLQWCSLSYKSLASHAPKSGFDATQEPFRRIIPGCKTVSVLSGLLGHARSTQHSEQDGFVHVLPFRQEPPALEPEPRNQKLLIPDF